MNQIVILNKVLKIGGKLPISSEMENVFKYAVKMNHYIFHI
jgi:hypothetical protein